MFSKIRLVIHTVFWLYIIIRSAQGLYVIGREIALSIKNRFKK